MRASIFPQLSACDIVRIVPNINIHTVKLKLIKQHYYITKILHSEIRVIIIQVSKQQLPKSIHRCNDKLQEDLWWIAVSQMFNELKCSSYQWATS